MTGGPVAVEARGLGRRFGRVWALRDCGFTLPAQRIVALVGANGAGKSTLMNVIGGVLPPTEGTLLVGGHAVARRRGAPAGPARRVALLAQNRPLYRDFTAADMLRFGRHTNRVWDERRAASWLARFGVPLDRRCGALSAGQRSRVALAVALGSRPGVLVLDEPLADLDPLSRSEVTGELLAEAVDSGMTVMLSSHVVAELSGVADHLLLLAAGRPVLCGDVDRLLAGHVRLTGPRAAGPPGPGTVVHCHHTARQSTFTVRLPEAAPPAPVVAPGWAARALTLEELVVAYLRAPRAPIRAAGAEVADTRTRPDDNQGLT